MMTLKGTTDPAKCRVTEDEVVVMREDAQAARDFAKEVKKEKGVLRQKWERSYYDDIRERYASREIAAAMLKMVWHFTAEVEESY